jgi:hypothetical protein
MALFALDDTAMICKERDNIMAYAKEKLNDEHQLVFVEHFMLSFVDPNDKLPIAGEKAMEWLGFSAKNKFKNFVTKNLTETQYSIFLNPTVEKSRGAGHLCENIKISVEGFKILEPR